MKTSADLEAALAASEDQPIIIFKESATCPFSAAAQGEVTQLKHDLPVYALVVQYAKELSQEIAEQLEVEHASPQAIVVHRRKAVSHHWRTEISEDNLRKSVAEVA
ncbi:MAG: monothiol bacilliredoxin BrxC family protein [Saprospiraceae bacterium]